MFVRRWGAVIVTTGWLVGLLMAAGRVSGSGRVVLGLLALAALALAGTVTWVASARTRLTLLPLDARWQAALAAVWFGAALLLGMARFAWSLPGNDPRNVANLPQGTLITVRGTIDAEPDVRANGAYLQIRVTGIQGAGPYSWDAADGVIQIFDAKDQAAFAPDYGDGVELQGYLAGVSPKAPPGIDATMHSAKVQILNHGGGNPILALLYAWRTGLARGLAGTLPAPEAALLTGIVLGLKTPLMRSRLNLFIRTGTIHLVVTSGLKVTLVGDLTARLVQPLGRAVRLALPLAAIVLYVILSGAGPAALRAGLMGTLLVAARALGRDYDAPTALALAAMILTAWQPTMLWDVGFQLSTAGTLGIITLGPFFHTWLIPSLGRFPGGRLLAESITATFAAQIGTFPLIAINFGIFSLISPLANLLLVPLLPLFLVLGGLIGFLGIVAAPVGDLLGYIAFPIFKLADLVVEGLAAPGWAALTVGALPGWLTPLWIAAIGLAPLLWRGRIAPHTPAATPAPPATAAPRVGLPATLRVGLALAQGIMLGAGTILLPHMATQPIIRVTFLDVGSTGPATLIQMRDGKVALVDGGGDGTRLLQALADRLPFWQRSIDLVVLTDPRAGHLRGLPALLGTYQLREVVDAGVLHPAADYASWFLLLQRAGVPLVRAAQGVTIALGPAHITVLSPTGPLLTVSDQEDNNALVFRLDAPGLSVLFAGEAGARALTNAMSDPHPITVVQFAAPPTPQRQAAQFNALTQSNAQMAVFVPASHLPAQGVVIPPIDPATTHAPPLERTGEIGSISIVSDGVRWWSEE